MSDKHDHSHAAGEHHAGHDHAGHSHDVGKADKGRVLIAAVLTGGFMVAEAVGGLLTGSLALLADAGHMLTDSVALILAWFAFRLAERRPTSSLTYGFDRFKILVAYTNGLTVFAIGGWIIYEAWHRFSDPAPVQGGPMLAIAVIGLMINITSFFVLHGGDRENLNMRGAILHVLGDLLGSVAAIVAALIILVTGWYPIDPILSVLVALLLFSSAWRLIQDSGHVLLEGVPPHLDRDTIARDLQEAIAGVVNVHHLHIWSLDGKRTMATLHAVIPDGKDASVAVRAIKKRLAETHGIAHATVETETEHCLEPEEGD